MNHYRKNGEFRREMRFILAECVGMMAAEVNCMPFGKVFGFEGRNRDAICLKIVEDSMTAPYKNFSSPQIKLSLQPEILDGQECFEW